jgi:hypothetical protein
VGVDLEITRSKFRKRGFDIVDRKSEVVGREGEGVKIAPTLYVVNEKGNLKLYEVEKPPPAPKKTSKTDAEVE